MKSKKIIFTGGGTAGHVTPNLALIEKFLQEQWEVFYVGSRNGIEKELISALEKVKYYAISSGKLRRYFSWQNFFDPCKIIYGIIQAIILCFKLKPDVIFSKGGFVAFPLVVAAWLWRIPVVVHESDLTVGLANKLCFPLATKICVTFSDSAKQIKDKTKVVITGTPIRKDFFTGDAKLGREICGFPPDRKIILVFGGSLGAERINLVVRQLLPNILEQFQIIHVCGKGKVDDSYQYTGYRQFEYLHKEFSHVLAAADIVIARAGANSIYELITLRKPSILLPLANGSRGDQVENAKYCVAHGISEIILDEQLTANSLLEKIEKIILNRDAIIRAMEQYEILPSVKIIYELVTSVCCL